MIARISADGDHGRRSHQGPQDGQHCGNPAGIHRCRWLRSGRRACEQRRGESDKPSVHHTVSSSLCVT
jgi:hypothetical protein